MKRRSIRRQPLVARSARDSPRFSLVEEILQIASGEEGAFCTLSSWRRLVTPEVTGSNPSLPRSFPTFPAASRAGD